MFNIIIVIDYPSWQGAGGQYCKLLLWCLVVQVLITLVLAEVWALRVPSSFIIVMTHKSDMSWWVSVINLAFANWYYAAKKHTEPPEY